MKARCFEQLPYIEPLIACGARKNNKNYSNFYALLPLVVATATKAMNEQYGMKVTLKLCGRKMTIVR